MLIGVEYTLAHADCEGELTHDGGELFLNFDDKCGVSLKEQIENCIDIDLVSLELGKKMYPTGVRLGIYSREFVSEEQVKNIMDIARAYIKDWGR